MTDQIGKVKTTGTRKWEERKSGSPETVEKPAKLVKSIDNQAMAALPSEAETMVRESSNTSLEDIKGILDNIQDTIARILHENGQLRDELKELKASLKSKDREVQNLQESLSKTCERNKALELELKAAKVKIDKQDGEIYNLWDNLDNLEQYTRKNSLEIHGVPKEAYSSTEEAVLAIANALDVDISSNDIEISHHLKRKNSNTAIIVKFANHKDKTKLYKARTKLKTVKTSSIFPRCTVTIPEFKDRIFINENLTGHRRYVMGQANKMRRNGLLLSCWSLDEKPGSPIIAQLDIQATTLTVKWTAPANDGGSPIIAYRVVILKDGAEIKSVNITDPGITSWNAGGLTRNTTYTVKVLARNSVFEGPAAEKEVRTKYEGVPQAATINDLPNEVTDSTITLTWSEPENNGKAIAQYIVYQRIVTDGKPGEWKELKTITDVSVRELKVELVGGKLYEFVVTATNFFGESLKEEGKVMRVKASGVPPTITFKSKGKVTIVKGNVLYLFCEAEGNPKPLVTWRKSGNVLQSNINKTELIIQDVSDNDAGVYECEVSNSGGTLTYTVEVTIKGLSCNELVLNIAYIIVIFVLLIIILILIIVLRRLRSGAAIPKRNRKNICAGCGGDLVALNTMASETKKRSSSIVPSGDSTTYAALSSGDYMPLHPSARSWELNREQVKILKVIGKGAFSQVAKATAWNISGDEEYSTVAVKMLKANAPDSDRNDLLSELEVMKRLKPHPHVIKLMGCVTESDPLLVLIEYVPYGDLLGYLRKSRGLNDTYFKDPDVKPQTNLTAEQLMRFAWQIADGMFYLSSRKIIHRDLAARNVLVGEGENCKVTDFGMARNVQQDDIYTKRSRGRLPVKWTAYEALLFGTYTTQSDVWSYGVLLYELLTVGGSPYPGIQARQIARKLQEGFRMPKPTHVDNKLYQIMLKCWEENPSDRPTFTKLKDMMKEIERNHRTYVNLKQYDNSLYANVEDLTAE